MLTPQEVEEYQVLIEAVEHGPLTWLPSVRVSDGQPVMLLSIVAPDGPIPVAEILPLHGNNPFDLYEAPDTDGSVQALEACPKARDAALAYGARIAAAKLPEILHGSSFEEAVAAVFGEETAKKVAVLFGKEDGARDEGFVGQDA
jgi:CelD/BcsL family acetyltransferase involved in cellulose biosynthesis